MRRVLSFFLFQTRPGDDLTKGKRIVFWIWNILALTFASLALGVFSLMLAPTYHGWELFWDYWSHPGLIALNLAPPVVLAVFLYGLTGRSWLAYFLTAVPVLALTAGNSYKVSFRNDPVVAADLLVLGEAGNMAGNYNLFMFGKLQAVLICSVLSVVCLALLARGRPRRNVRIVTAAAALAAGVALTPVYRSDKIYDSIKNTKHVNRWLSADQYMSRGLLYPFLYSVKDAVPHPPEGYSDKEAAALLAEYEDTDIPEDKKVNIVGIMLEAYNDFTKFDVPGLKTDMIYGAWHELEEEGYSGDLVTNIFAGGTVDTERNFITGMFPLSDYNEPSNSYAWYFRSQGYRVTGMHPGFQWFYNRKNVNEFLGFEDYMYVENFFTTKTNGWVGNDYTFLTDLLWTYSNETAAGQPYFSFSVSYQGHGPYSDSESAWSWLGYFVDNEDGRYTKKEHYIMENYFSSLENTNRCLKALTDYFRTDDKPVVLVLFGDHNPWMGNNNSVYKAMGIDFDLSDREGFKDYYATRYIIWANDAAKEVLGRDIQGEGPDLSPCFLMNKVFELCGWEGPAYMQAIQEAADLVPIQNTATDRCFGADSDIDELTPEEEDVVSRFRKISYYYQRHFHYGDLLDAAQE